MSIRVHLFPFLCCLRIILRKRRWFLYLSMSRSISVGSMVLRFLEDGGSKAEITGYESSIIENLNASQSNLVFKKTGCRYSVIMEVVSADEDDAELSGWMYLYDNKSLEKIAAAKIKAE